MKEVLLVCGAILPLIYLFFVMDRLDHDIWESRHQATKTQREDQLRIAFENLEAGTAMANFLKDFSEKHTHYHIQLYYNERSKILKSLRQEKLDIGFLVGKTFWYEDGVFCRESIQMKEQNLCLKDLKIPIIPLSEHNMQLNVFLKMDEQNPKINLFLKEFFSFFQSDFQLQNFASCESAH